MPPLTSQATRRRFLLSALGLTAASLTGCGTILYPERRGQPAGRLDWGVVALDAIGLLLFFIPGVIAFAVDFSNGTIYLPPDGYGATAPQPTLVPVELGQAELTPDRVESVVSQHLQQDFQLKPGEFRTEELKDLKEFWQVENRLRVG